MMRKYLVPLSFLMLMAGAICSPLVLLPSRAQDSSPYARFLLPRPSDPVGVREGQLYANTASHAPKYYNGSAWVTIQTGSSGGVASAFLAGGNGSAPNSVSTTSTVYGTFGAVGTSTTPNSWQASENARQLLAPVAATYNNFCVITTGAQPGDGTAVYTFRDNGSNTALTFTISAGGVAGLYCDNTHTVSVAAGHLIGFSVTNNSLTANSATTSQWSVAYH
jgi:hypothetical protein